MASKHPHKPYLFNHRTWKCAVEGCRWFVHLGLQHLIINSVAVCWNCGELYTVDEAALKSPKPICMDCRLAGVISEQPAPDVVQSVTEPKTTGGRTPEQQKLYEKEMREMFGPDWKKMLNS